MANPADEYQSPPAARRAALFAFAAIGVAVAILTLFPSLFDSSPTAMKLMNAVTALTLATLAIFQLLRLFNPARQKANEDARWTEAENLSGERFMGAIFLLMATGLAYLSLRDVWAQQTYLQPWFFFAPAILLVIVGRQFQFHDQFKAEMSVDDLRQNTTPSGNMRKISVGALFILAGAVTALFGLARLWMAQS